MCPCSLRSARPREGPALPPVGDCSGTHAVRGRTGLDSRGLCDGLLTDHEASLGVSFPEVGPGAYFRISFMGGRAKEIACATFSLQNDESKDEEGVVRCVAPSDSDLAGMHVVFNNRCRSYLLAVFDDAYLAKAPAGR